VCCMANDAPKWRRRKQARPTEIIDAALAVFAESGFATARLEEIARRAGIAKSSLYLYFETKEELFRAVVRSAIAPGFDQMEATATSFDGPFAELAPQLLRRVAALMTNTRLPAVARMVIGESRNFPDLARIWHDEVVSKLIDACTSLVTRAQLRGELHGGDARLHAFSLFGPLIMALLFREVFAGIAPEPPDLEALAIQHARTALRGLLRQTAGD
jgi:AcrR family transcriptional regulator